MKLSTRAVCLALLLCLLLLPYLAQHSADASKLNRNDNQDDDDKGEKDNVDEKIVNGPNTNKKNNMLQNFLAKVVKVIKKKPKEKKPITFTTEELNQIGLLFSLPKNIWNQILSYTDPKTAVNFALAMHPLIGQHQSAKGAIVGFDTFEKLILSFLSDFANPSEKQCSDPTETKEAVIQALKFYKAAPSKPNKDTSMERKVFVLTMAKHSDAIGGLARLIQCIAASQNATGIANLASQLRIEEKDVETFWHLATQGTEEQKPNSKTLSQLQWYASLICGPSMKQSPQQYYLSKLSGQKKNEQNDN